jgi:hypothetical protein
MAYDASCTMIAPLAVTAGSPEVSHDTPTLREWSKTAPLALRAASRDKNTSSLDEHGIDVRRSVGTELLRCDGPSYERHITSWQSQDCLLQLVVAQRRQLLTTDEEDGVLVCWGGSDGGGGGVVQDESPSHTLAAGSYERG